MKKLDNILLFLALLLPPSPGCAQRQEADNDYRPVVEQPVFPQGTGPLLLVDCGHQNFHTLEDRFAPFGRVAELNGFRVRSIKGTIDGPALAGAKVLVITNALHEQNVGSWKQPVLPAFTEQEIKAVREWVNNGGSLFLIADHMPFAGAVAGLAGSMGFTMYDGFAYSKPNQKFDIFSFGNGMLGHTELTKGIDSIVSFTGQAFSIPGNAISVITLDTTYRILMPETAWAFSRDMKMLPAGGLSQLAYCRYGSGKVVVAGEAAMFTAQKAGDIKFGLNAPFARHNLGLLINILAWLGK